MPRRLAAFLMLSGLCGCGELLPTPAEPKPTTQTADAKTEKREPLPEDAPELKLEEGFEQLGLDAFEKFFSKDPGQSVVWEQAGNGFNCNGKPRGYLYSKQPYANFTLKLDYRFRRPADLTDDASFKGNTGVMIFITGEHKQWPISLEVQGKYSEMGTIKANGGATNVEIEDNEHARSMARKPVGEWNHIEVVAHEGALQASINGTKVCESKQSDLKDGLLGFQAEDFEVQFRNVRVRRD